ncbi:unnamed protein product [Closterium sp. NIES-54]
MVTTTTPGGQRVSICTCTWTGRHLATITCRPGSSLYTLATEPPQVAASAQVSASGQVAASCSCRLLSNQTLLWHHRLGHPSLPRLRGMHSRLLVSGLPRSLPPLPPSPTPPCLPCVKGWQRAAPHSSSFPPTTAPLQTLHMDVWGPACVSGQGHEHYFLLVVDDHTRYTTVFPLRSKGEVSAVLIPWIRTVRLQLRERVSQDLLVLRLHSDRGGEFSSDLLRDICRGEGITRSFTLPDSPQQNGIAERRIGLVMEVARTSMIHAAAPHFLWPFAALAQEALEVQELELLTLAQEPASPLPVPSPYTEQSGGLTERREPASRLFALLVVLLVRVLLLSQAHTPWHSILPLFHCVFLCLLLLSPSVPASPPSVGGECALGTDVLEDRQEDFECLAAAIPRFASLLLALEGDPDAPDISTPRSYTEAITGPYSSQWQAAMDAKMASWKSRGTYVDEFPPHGVNILDGMWIFRVKRPPGSPSAFKARYIAQGFSQRQGVDYFHTFSPTSKMTTIWVLLHVAAQRDYELHSLDFGTAFLQGSLHEEIWLRRPPGFTGSFPTGTQWSLRRPVYGLRKAPRECHDTLRTTLAALGFVPSTAHPSLFLRTDTSLPPFYVLMYVDDLVFATTDTEALTLVKSELQKRHTCTDLGELRSYLGLQITRDRARRTITLTQSHIVYQVLQRFGFQYSSPQLTPLSTSHSLSAPPSDKSVEPSGPYPELVGCLMHLMTCTRPDLAYPLSLLARYVAHGRHRKELRWLTNLLTDLGEQPRSPPVLYVDNKAMIALCQEHRLEHRTKHIALRYFLARELQQRGQLRLAYMATRANTADVFTKALPPGDHQRFVTVLGLVPTLPHLLTA